LGSSIDWPLYTMSIAPMAMVCLRAEIRASER
jgi:hypothetical protein